MDNRFVEFYLDVADRVSELSRARRLKVGAVIVKDHRILSYGYNGTPSGFPNVCEANNVTFEYVLHAESNAITKACKSPISTEGATMYCTHACCVHCAKLVIQSGITTFVYLEDYRDRSGVELLITAGLDVIKAKQL